MKSRGDAPPARIQVLRFMNTATYNHMKLRLRARGGLPPPRCPPFFLLWGTPAVRSSYCLLGYSHRGYPTCAKLEAEWGALRLRHRIYDGEH